MQTVLDKILEGSESLFSRYGIKSITMDDVSRELGISKKTLYQYVTDKNDLVEKTLELHLERNRRTCELLAGQANAIDAMLGIGDFFCQQMKDISPTLMFDLRKYHTSAWQKLDEYKRLSIARQLENNLEQGIKDGYYRADISIKIVPRLYMGMVDSILERPYMVREEYRFEYIVNEMLMYHIHGIATQKGLDYLKQKLNKINT